MITIENCSPFPHFLFEKVGLRGEPFDVLVVGGTFEIVHGSALVPSNQQPPLIFADEYYGDAMSSSLRHEGNLVIAKKSTDIHVVGHARAPRGTPVPEWQAAIRVGKLFKRLRATGRRWWEHTSDRWRISAPEPCIEVPLRYELAYGGSTIEKQLGSEEGKVAHQANPIGVGFLGTRPPDPNTRYPAPQFESWDTPIREITAVYPVEGFGPICRWWEPRRQKAGTYDEAWRKERFPAFPDDFDFAFYNAAHPDLIYDGFLDGCEAVSLTGFFPEDQLDTNLPGFSVVGILKDRGDYAQSEELRLDTVTFDTDARTANLVWRKTVPRSWGLASIAIGAIPPCGSSEDRPPRLAQLHE